MNDGCAGWRKISISGPTLDYLDANDRQALAQIIAHAEFGQAQGCWK